MLKNWNEYEVPGSSRYGEFVKWLKMRANRKRRQLELRLESMIIGAIASSKKHCQFTTIAELCWGGVAGLRQKADALDIDLDHVNEGAFLLAVREVAAKIIPATYKTEVRTFNDKYTIGICLSW